MSERAIRDAVRVENWAKQWAVRRPACVVVLLALANKTQQMIDRGAVSAAAASRGLRLGRRRARSVRIGRLTFGSCDQSIFG